MLPRRTVPKLPLERPTNESRDAQVPVPTSKLVDVSICQIAFSPPKLLPRPRSPRKPMYEFPTLTLWRGNGSAIAAPAGMVFVRGEAAVPMPPPENVATAEPGCVELSCEDQPNCG